MCPLFVEMIVCVKGTAIALVLMLLRFSGGTTKTDWKD